VLPSSLFLKGASTLPNEPIRLETWKPQVQASRYTSECREKPRKGKICAKDDLEGCILAFCKCPHYLTGGVFL